MDGGFTPACVTTGAEELKHRAQLLYRRGASCDWCPRKCGANRTGGDTGDCGVGKEIRVASANLHFGEEHHFVGTGGSGTVFFSGCNLGCLFCQNHDLSHGCRGMRLNPAELARVFMMLQEQGAENLNLVTPSHYPADILMALATAVEDGFRMPVVWNSGGYDSIDTLGMFNGVVDIYMPDFKFASNAVGARMTEVSDYASVAKAALAEMVRQTGPELMKDRDIARRGVSVRHLVMPGFYDDSRACLDSIHAVSLEITVNVMSQYRPAYRAREVPELGQRVDHGEFSAVVAHGKKIGLVNVLNQA